jgi:lipoate-protein ligase A
MRIGATRHMLSLMRWRLLSSPAGTGVQNMAMDDALMDRARATGEAVFRVYTWSRPTLSLGRNQAARDAWDTAAAASRGIDIVRRPTGGRALLHHREITYSVTAPVDQDESLRDSYTFINSLLVDALSRLGVSAALAQAGGGGAPLTDAPCFETPSAGELVVGPRKLAGSAQWRERDAFLQHGSILIDDDQGLIASLSARPQPPVPPPATLREILGRAPRAAEFAEAMHQVLRGRADPGADPLTDTAALDAEAAGRAARYADDAWTWRR